MISSHDCKFLILKLLYENIELKTNFEMGLLYIIPIFYLTFEFNFNTVWYMYLRNILC